MAKVAYVKPEEIPAVRATVGSRILEAMEHLEAARERRQALKITLGSAERRAVFMQRYRKAADRLNLTVRFAYSEPRLFVHGNVRQDRETSVLYIVVDRAANERIVPLAIPPIDVAAAEPLVAHRERRAVEQVVARPTPSGVVAADPVAVRRQREAADLREERQQEMDALLNVKRPAKAPTTDIPARKSAVVWERR